MKTCSCGAALSMVGPDICLPCYNDMYGRIVNAPTINQVQKILSLAAQDVPLKQIASKTVVNADMVERVLFAHAQYKARKR